MKKKNIKLCSEPNCYKEVDLDREFGDVIFKPDGTIYERSLKCWNCRTEADRKAIKAKRKQWRIFNLTPS